MGCCVPSVARGTPGARVPSTHPGARRSPGGTVRPCLGASGHRRRREGHLGTAGTSLGMPPAAQGCPRCPLTHHGGTQRGGAVPCCPAGSAAAPRRAGCLHQGRGPAQPPLPGVPSAPRPFPPPSTQGPPAPSSTRVLGGPWALTARSRALPTAGRPNHQGLPGDARHRWGILHCHPAQGQLLTQRWQLCHDLGTGAEWHRGTPFPWQGVMGTAHGAVPRRCSPGGVGGVGPSRWPPSGPTGW